MKNKGATVVFVFLASLALLALLVFAYTYISGGGPLEKSYLSAYVSLPALLLLVGAAMAPGRERKGS